MTKNNGNDVSIQMLKHLAAMKYDLATDFMALQTIPNEENTALCGMDCPIASDLELRNLLHKTSDDTAKIVIKPTTMTISCIYKGDQKQMELDVRKILGDDGAPSLAQLQKVIADTWDIPLRGFAVDGDMSAPLRTDNDLTQALLEATQKDGGKLQIVAREGTKPIRLLPEAAILSDSLKLGPPDEYYPSPIEFRCAPDVASWELAAAGVAIPGFYRAIIEVASDGMGQMHAGFLDGAGAANGISKDWEELRKTLPIVKYGTKSFERYSKVATNAFPYRGLQGDKFVITDAGYCFNVRSVSLELVGPLVSPGDHPVERKSDAFSRGKEN